MGKSKYHFNPESLSYHKIEMGFHDLVKAIFTRFSISLVIGTALFIFVYHFVDSPQEKILKRQRNQLLAQYELLNKRIEHTSLALQDIQSRDNDMYRSVFEASPIPSSIRKAGFGGTKCYEKFAGFDNSDVLIESTQKIDVMTKELYIQSKSFDEIVNLIKNKEKMLVSIPAIQPVSNKVLTAFGPFGMRFHPILRYWRMHKGVDLVCAKGTKVYTSGDGVVVQAEYTNGLGNTIVVSHGYGFQTVYGHLSKMSAHVGQRVKRGEVIALVGSTGLSMTPHLHYEVHRNHIAVDPVNYYYDDLGQSEYDKMIKMSSTATYSTYD